MSEKSLVKYLQHQLRIRQLEIVLAVSEHSSVLHASTSLNMTQPAVTKSIQEMERSLGSRLFERTTKGMRPTKSGEALLNSAQKVMGSLDRAASELYDLSTGKSGHVRVGVSVSISELLARSIARMKESHPNIGVEIIQSTNEALAPQLRSGDIDLIVGQPSEPWESGGISHEKVFEDRILIVSRHGHELSRSGTALSLQDLLAYKWILPLSETALRRTLEEAFEEAGVELPGRSIELMSIDVIQSLLSNTNMITALPSRVASVYLENSVMSVVPVEFENLVSSVYISTGSSRQLTSGAIALCDHIKYVAGAFSGG